MTNQGGKQLLSLSSRLWMVFFCWFIFWSGSQSCCCEAAYIIEIPPIDEQCFFISSGNHPKSTLYGNYDLLQDNVNPSPLSILIMDMKTSQVLYKSTRGSREGKFKVDLYKGPFQKVHVCIQNGLWRDGALKVDGKDKDSDTKRPNKKYKPFDQQTRIVGMEMEVEPFNEAMEMEQTNSRLIRNAREVYRQLKQLKNHHDYMRNRESMHREVVEQTFTNLLFWGMFLGLAVAAVAGGQILYLRRFVEVRRYV